MTKQIRFIDDELRIRIIEAQIASAETFLCDLDDLVLIELLTKSHSNANLGNPFLDITTKDKMFLMDDIAVQKETYEENNA